MPEQQSVVFKVPGISCDGCAGSIQKILDAVTGVEESSVEVSEKTVSISFSQDQVTEEHLRTRLAEAGYPTE